MKYLKKLIRFSLALTIIVASGLPVTSALSYDNTFAIQAGHPVDEQGYPYIPRMNMTVIDAVKQVDNTCKTAYLDTKSEHGFWLGTEIGDHHQSIVKTNEFFGVHRYWITHSEMDDGDKGQVMSFAGPRKDFYQTPYYNRGLIKNHDNKSPLGLISQYRFTEQHPSQAAWLPGVLPNNSQSQKISRAPGYLFVAMEKQQKIYVKNSVMFFFFPIDVDFSANIVTLHRKGDYYWLLAGNGNNGDYKAYVAHKSDLFPDVNQIGSINLDAFTSLSDKTQDFSGYNLSHDDTSRAITFGQNATLVQDVDGGFYLLATQNTNTDDWNIGYGDDYVLVWDVEIENPSNPGSTAGASFTINPSDDDPYYQHLVFPSDLINFTGPNCAAGCTFQTDIDGTLFVDVIGFYADEFGELGNFKSKMYECTTGQDGCGGPYGLLCDAETEYCDYNTPGSCGLNLDFGICTPKPDFYSGGSTVCGCDGNTYDSESEAQQAGVAALQTGSCSTSNFEVEGPWTVRNYETKRIADVDNNVCMLSRVRFGELDTADRWGICSIGRTSQSEWQLRTEVHDNDAWSKCSSSCLSWDEDLFSVDRRVTVMADGENNSAYLGSTQNTFCGLGKVGFEDIDSNGEWAMCRVRRSGNFLNNGNDFWELEAKLGQPSNDAQAKCSSQCFHWAGANYTITDVEIVSLDSQRGTDRKTLEPTESAWCALTQVLFEDLDSSDEGAECKVYRSDGFWKLKAFLGSGGGPDARVKCGARCLKW